MNPLSLMESLDKDVMYWHNRGLSQFGISAKLHIHYWTAQAIIEKELQKDFDSLFRGGEVWMK